MADPYIDDTLFDSKLEHKLRKWFVAAHGAEDGSYAQAGKAIADALRKENRNLSDGIELVEEYCELAGLAAGLEETSVSIDDVSRFVVSTVCTLGNSGLTGKMAADVLDAYSTASPYCVWVDKTSGAANSTLNILRKTYQSPKWALMLIDAYSETLKGRYHLEHLSSGVNATLKELCGGNFRRDDVRKLIQAYEEWSAETGSIHELSEAVCRSIAYSRTANIPLNRVAREIRDIAIRDNDRGYSAGELCDKLTGKLA